MQTLQHHSLWLLQDLCYSLLFQQPARMWRSDYINFIVIVLVGFHLLSSDLKFSLILDLVSIVRVRLTDRLFKDNSWPDVWSQFSFFLSFFRYLSSIEIREKAEFFGVIRIIIVNLNLHRRFHFQRGKISKTAITLNSL